MDFIFTPKGWSSLLIKAITPEGYKWIRQMMDHEEDFTVTIDSENEEEIKELMRKDGLNI